MTVKDLASQVCPHFLAAQQAVATSLSSDEDGFKSPSYFSISLVAFLTEREREVQQKNGAASQYHALNAKLMLINFGDINLEVYLLCWAFCHCLALSEYITL